MLVCIFMSHGLSVSIVKYTVLSCGSACVNQCPALPTASAMHTVTRFLCPQIQWTWMHPGCCTDPIPIIWVTRAHRRPGGFYHHPLTVSVAPKAWLHEVLPSSTDFLRPLLQAGHCLHYHSMNRIALECLGSYMSIRSEEHTSDLQ